MTTTSKNPQKRSPLKERPLRYAGQSVNERIEDRFTDALECWVIAWLLIILAGLEWWRSYRQDTFHPFLYTFIAVVGFIFCGWKSWKIFKEIKLLKLGRDGELIVAEFLEPLSKSGYSVLHDVVGGNFNVDHVLIGPTGVFVIETKTRSKSGGAEETVQFDGTNIFIHGKAADPNPLIQAKANARWIRELLKTSTSKDFPVFPVVLFPGWYVEQKVKQNDALVLNPKNLESFLKNRSVVLPASDASMAAFHLKQFIRSKK
jgi:hypothetical protein